MANIPISLLDIYPILCELANTIPPYKIDRESISNNFYTIKYINEKYIMSEYMTNEDKGQNIFERIIS